MAPELSTALSSGVPARPEVAERLSVIGVLQVRGRSGSPRAALNQPNGVYEQGEQ
jgi:hypothetical protein